MRTRGGGATAVCRLQERPGKTRPGGTLTSDFQPAGLRENNRLTSELPRLGAWLPGGWGEHGEGGQKFHTEKQG